MKRGSHAADDGSFGRSAGTAVLRGAILIIVAVVLGLILLNATDTNEPFTAAPDDDGNGSPSTTVDEGGNGGGTTTTTEATVRPPGQVSVLVANATSTSGVARQFSDDLAAQGYQMLEPTDARTKPLPSGVFYIEGYEAEARALALTLDPAPPVQAMPAEPPVADLGGAHVLLVVGDELTG